MIYFMMYVLGLLQLSFLKILKYPTNSLYPGEFSSIEKFNSYQETLKEFASLPAYNEM